MMRGGLAFSGRTATTEGGRRRKVVRAATSFRCRMQKPMRFLFALTVFAAAASMGRNVNADSPDGAAPPEHRRFSDRFRRHDPTPKPANVPDVKRDVSQATSSRPSAPPPRMSAAGTNLHAPDAPVRRVQAGPGDVGFVPPLPEAALPASPMALETGQNLSLQAALYGALTSNPDLISSPPRERPGQRRIARGGGGRESVSDRAQPDALGRCPAARL